jgi:hypothetical protein
LKQVCAPFESTGAKYCFLSCEAADLRPAADAGTDAGAIDPNAYCQREATAQFSCRSSGGGATNRKICLPTNPISDASTDAPIDAPADAPDGG